MESMLGKTLGQYQLVEQIGRGGMATVYKAYQPSLSRNVAVKILPSYYVHEPGFAERFTREAKAIAQLDHPNILPVYDFGKEGDISYIVMKYVRAGTLRDKLGTPLSPAQALEIIEQIAGALDNAHEQGILHRDIKPGNILVDDRDWVYLSDFGLAKMVEGSVQLTGSGVGVGTPTYMSPEQGKGISVDARTDVYSLGVILFEMLTGRVPYEAETPMAVVVKHITDPVPLPRQMNPNIPEPVEQVLLKALAKDREHRFDSAGEMAAALRQAVQNLEPGVAMAPIPPDSEVTALHPSVPPPSSPPAQPQVVPPPTPPPSPAPVARRKGLSWLPIIGGVAGLVVIGLCVVAGLFFFANRGGGLSSTPAGAQSVDTPTALVSTASLPTPVPVEVTPATSATTGPTDTPLPADTPSPQPADTSTPSGDTVSLSTDTPTPRPTDTPTSSATVPLPTDTPTATPSPSPTVVPSPTSGWPDTGLRPYGRYADVWNALNAGSGELGYPTANPVGDRLCARQNFERGYMVWFDSPQDPDPVWAAVISNPSQNNDSKSYKFTDTWPGNPEYWCSEAEAKAPLGPKRGFGMLWCIYPDLRTDVGNALDEEVGGPDYPACAVQPFQGGAIVHTPLDAKYWVFIDNGGWYRFDE